MRKAAAILCLALVAATSAWGDSLDLAFNDESAQLRYDLLVNQDYYGKSLLKARFLYNDDEETRLGSLGFAFVGEPGNIPGLELGVGVDLDGGRTDPGEDILALAVGALFAYAPPSLGGLGLSARGYYAPRIFSLLDVERLVESEVRLGFAITPKISLHVGYQNIRADVEDHGWWTIDEGVRAGFTAQF